MWDIPDAKVAWLHFNTSGDMNSKVPHMFIGMKSWEEDDRSLAKPKSMIFNFSGVDKNLRWHFYLQEGQENCSPCGPLGLDPRRVCEEDPELLFSWQSKIDTFKIFKD